VINELISSELAYVQGLFILVKEFVEPLKQNPNILPAEEVNNIFSNVETIYLLNEELYKNFKKHFAQSQQMSKLDKNVAGQAELGSVFFKLADYLKMYYTYCTNHNQSLEKHNFCRKKYGSYDKFITQVETGSRCGGLSLHDFLIKPIQRICKYPLLLRELLSCTPETHPDYVSVLKTFQKINEVTEHVNKITKHFENSMKLSNFDEQVT